MARKGKGTGPKAESYRHDEKRKNNPEAGLIEFVPKVKEQKKTYCWDPRESPQLIWAGKAGMKKVEVDEKASVEVPIVNLHIHERVSTEAILRSAMRKDAQRNLFADPELDFKDEIKFYQHDVDWSNRMILGDSLLVMNSLLEREGMRGKVQCIYMDPPYGIKYASNFQPRIDQRDVKDGKDEDLTREVMQVQAFRDTWELGVHSYLTYLRDRLLLSRELLADSGSIFVQIGDENVHRVRCLMDEVFGEENFCSLISYGKTTSTSAELLPALNDYLVWFAKDRQKAKYRQLFRVKALGSGIASRYELIELPDGTRRSLSDEDFDRLDQGELVGKPYTLAGLDSQGISANTSVEYKFRGRKFWPGQGRHWSTGLEGLDRLSNANRLEPMKSALRYVRYLIDYPAFALANDWQDVGGIQDRSQGKLYAVQTSSTTAQRCILMTTDPGDLVLDPTCGSGTTAYVAEQWGRRWITMDTSRVALAIARHRLMTAAFDYYKLRHPTSGVSGGFVYKTVPHITLKSIAQNTEIDRIAEEFQPQIDKALAQLNEALRGHKLQYRVTAGGREGALLDFTAPDSKTTRLPAGQEARVNALLEWEVPREFPDDWPKKAQESHEKFWRLKREMQAQIDASIQRNAPTEELVDQPEKVPGIVRVSGPFTMEALPNVAAEVSMEYGVGLVDGADSGMMEVTVFEGVRTGAVNTGSYVSDLIEMLRKSGVFTKGGKKIVFDSIRALDHEVVHAEGEFVVNGNGESVEDADIAALRGKNVKCAVIFGPKNGAISELHVREGVRAAGPYDAILFCGYEFTAPAQEVLNSDPIPGKRLMMAIVNADTAMSDLLKNTKASQIFTMIGEPDVVVYRYGDPHLEKLVEDAKRRGVDLVDKVDALKEGEIFVELKGVDLYDPVTGKTESDSGANVHAIFIDHDYDGKSFCICQALFPNKKDSWAKIARNLKGTIDEEAFEAMRSLVSLPFKPGKMCQVKVIDVRGNALVKTLF